MKTLLTLLLFFILISCKEDVKATYSITIYGSNNCGYTSALKTDLAKNNIAFTYCDINTTPCSTEFYTFVKDNKLDTNNYVNLPVVKVVIQGKTYGFVRPSIETIKALIDLTSALLIYNSTRDLIGIQGARFIDVYNISGIRLLHSDNNYINIQSLVSGLYIMVINKKTTLKFLKI
jgi:glutaredoxin